ncbi:MAG: 3-hydroxyacyl-ACP dehydratase [Bacteroidia bacterium]
MLKQIDFYTLNNFSVPEAGKVQAQIKLNASHAIFKGHFPESPVVPGVCLIQISKEMLEKSLDATTQLVQSSQVKFLAVVDPTVNAVLQIALDTKEQDGLISANAAISAGEKVFFKFKGVFRRDNG